VTRRACGGRDDDLEVTGRSPTSWTSAFEFRIVTDRIVEIYSEVEAAALVEDQAYERSDFSWWRLRRM
jgi:hypothetical protein